MSAAAIIILILALLLVIFTLQNTMLVSLKIFFWELTDVPLVLTLIVCLIIGFLVAFILYYPSAWKMKKKIKNLQKQVDDLGGNTDFEVSTGEDYDLGNEEETEEGFFKE
ncbi:LapA family protein [Sunxiuqinia sp. A32]|uniref:LapA family protein n=1 Tax=Sunxiuqinia sp. A32 TaxID=3461496 RepID=UPI0040458A17